MLASSSPSLRHMKPKWNLGDPRCCHSLVLEVPGSLSLFLFLTLMFVLHVMTSAFSVHSRRGEQRIPTPSSWKHKSSGILVYKMLYNVHNDTENEKVPHS